MRREERYQRGTRFLDLVSLVWFLVWGDEPGNVM